MQRRYATATTLVLLGIAGCSSAPPSGPNLPNGALPGGTAQITVNGNGTGRVGDVQCERIGKGLTEIKIGDDGNLTTVLITADSPKGIDFHDVAGFTGSYWQDLQGSARMDIVDQTYTLTGTAAGFNTENPYARTMNGFTVKVAC
jgi:ipoprotein LpqH